MHIVERRVGNVTILDIHGAIRIGDGDDELRASVEECIRQEKTAIVLNLEDTPYLDAAGLGEIHRIYTARE